MKIHSIITILMLASCLTGCQFLPQISWEATPTPAPIEPYQDVRNLDLTKLEGALDAALIQTLWFNQATRWPEAYEAAAQDILTRGMNPGLGIRQIHEQGIRGEGVTVAIIDQNLVPDHPEYQGKIVRYFDVGTDQPADQGSMHGPAVASLLVGENIGTAPGAKVYFVAAPSWTQDAKYQADALNWILDENEKLAQGEKMRVVSISAAPSGPGSPFTKNQEAWEAAYQRAAEAGLLVLDCSAHRGITAPCTYDLEDPDNFSKCVPGWPGEEAQAQPMPGRIYIPTSHRTTAEAYSRGNDAYQYTGRGGCSWSVPYLAGVLALGWQARPDLTGEQLLALIFQSAFITEGGFPIINPPAFIERVQLADQP